MWLQRPRVGLFVTHNTLEAAHGHLRAFRGPGSADTVRGIVEPYFAGQAAARGYGENIAGAAAA